jgi:hypothetical protein
VTSRGHDNHTYSRPIPCQNQPLSVVTPTGGRRSAGAPVITPAAPPSGERSKRVGYALTMVVEHHEGHWCWPWPGRWTCSPLRR